MRQKAKDMHIALIDYKKGNIKSVERSLLDAADMAVLPASVTLVDAPDALRCADAIVLPGVGAFKDAMDTLAETGLDRELREQISKGAPFLGICLGLHLIYEAGTEHAENGTTPGLGVIDGVVDSMPAQDMRGTPFKVPHVGWNTVRQRAIGDAASPLFKDIADDEYFYFTHSYIAPVSPLTIGETEHSVVFPSAVQAENVFGVQFHPEKSSTPGIRLLANFLDFAARV